jgi:transcriptional regulator with XRE-family HTH domain
MARTPKSQALGRAMRRARLARGLTLRDFAAQLDRDFGSVSRWETGDRTPSPEQVARHLTLLGVGSADFEEIMTLAHGTQEPLWLAATAPERRQQQTAYLDWEDRATRIVEVAPLLVPGLLRTRGYAEAMLLGDGVAEAEREARITRRAARRKALDRPHPAKLLVLLGIAALRQEIGGPDGTRDQLHQLLRSAEKPNVELRIVPDRRGWHPALETAFTLIETDEESVVLVETRCSTLLLHTRADVTAYRDAADRIRTLSLDPTGSRALLHDLARPRTAALY